MKQIDLDQFRTIDFTREIPLADPKRILLTYAPSVQFLSFLCSSWQIFRQIIDWCTPWGWHPLWEILDPLLNPFNQLPYTAIAIFQHLYQQDLKSTFWTLEIMGPKNLPLGCFRHFLATFSFLWQLTPNPLEVQNFYF